MATRFHLTSAKVSVLAVTPSSSWEYSSNPVYAGLAARRLGSPFASSGTSEYSTSGVYDVLLLQFTSQPLAAQTIAGYVKGIIRAREDTAGADFRAQMCIRVVSSDGSVVRGTLLAHDESALASEFNTVLTNRKFPLGWVDPGATLTSVAVQLGDRIVVEAGFRAHNTSSSYFAGYLESGDVAAQDCAENETDQLQYNPWIEFSQTLLFQEWESQELNAGYPENSIDLETSSTDTQTQRSPEFAVAGGTVTEPPVDHIYLKRARDLGSPTPVYIEWETGAISGPPPDPAPIGPWGEIVIIGRNPIPRNTHRFR